MSIRAPGAEEMYFTAGPSLWRRPIGCWVEALAMFGLAAGAPVAG